MRHAGRPFSVLINVTEGSIPIRPVKGTLTVHPSLLSDCCLLDGPEGVRDLQISLSCDFIAVTIRESHT